MYIINTESSTTLVVGNPVFGGKHAVGHSFQGERMETASATPTLTFPAPARFVVEMSRTSAEIRLTRDGSIGWIRVGGNDEFYDFHVHALPHWIRVWLKIEVAIWRSLISEQHPTLHPGNEASFFISQRDEENDGEDILCVLVFYAQNVVSRNIPLDSQQWGPAGQMEIKFYYLFSPTEVTFRKHG